MEFALYGNYLCMSGNLFRSAARLSVAASLAFVLSFSLVGRASAAIGDPDLLTQTTVISLTAPDSQIVEVYSTDLPFGNSIIDATMSDESVAIVNSTKETTGNIATFRVTAVAHGFTTVTFSLDGYNPITLNVTVDSPTMVTFPDVISGVVSGVVTAEISSNDQPFTPGTLVHAESSRPGVASVDMPDVEVGPDGSAYFSFTGVGRGTGFIQFTLDGYAELAVPISIGYPSLVATPADLDLILGTTETIDVFSTDVLLADPTAVTVTASREGFVDAAIGPGDAPDVARFTLSGLAVGLTTLTFHAPGNTDSEQVVVNVIEPKLSVGPLPSALVIGTTEYLEVDSPDVAIGSDLVMTAQSSDENVILIGDIPFPQNGSVSIPIQIVGSGSAIVTISAPGFNSASIAIPVSIPSLEARDQYLEMVAGGTTTLSIWSPDLPLPDGMPMDITVGNSNVVSASDSPSAIDGIAEITLTGGVVGSTTLLVSLEGYRPVTVVVRVVRAELLVDLSQLTMFAGETQTLNVSAADYSISDGAAIVASTTGDNVLIGDPILQGDGSVDFPITGVTAGRTTITLDSADGSTFFSTTALVNVVAPRLNVDNSDFALDFGEIASVNLSSDDFDLPDDLSITATVCDQGGVTVDDIPGAWDGSSTVTFTGTRGGTCVVTLSADPYASVSVRITVAPPPPINLGSINFARKSKVLDAKSTAALDAFIARIDSAGYTKITLGGYRIIGDGVKGIPAATLAQAARAAAVQAYLSSHLPPTITYVIRDVTATAKKGFAKSAKGRNTYRRVDITAGN